MKMHYMNLNDKPFKMIKNQKKTIELRLNDEKRKKIEVGDNIEFSNTLDSTNKLLVKVIQIYKFNNFKELYAYLPLDKCGYEKKDLPKAKYSDMEEYYSLKQQETYGVVGIEIALLKSL